MNQDTVTYLLLFIITLIACIALFRIGKKIICFIILLVSIYCGVNAFLYYMADDYELPKIETIMEKPEIEEIELPDVNIELPTISYEENKDAFGFGLDEIID